VTEDAPSHAAFGHDVFVSYASQDAVDHAAIACGVVTQCRVPGRREAILSGCGRTLLFCTPRHMISRAHLGSLSLDFAIIAPTATPE
jgi:hypothetical protein